MGYGGIIGQTGVSGEYLPLTGGTLTGNLDMSNHGIQNVTSISSSNSALIVPNNINVNSHRILNLSQPVNNTDAANKAYVDSKASNWIKAATHSQYDEWHLAVEGGTFVKLVANTEIQMVLEDVEPNTVKINSTQLDTPTLKPLYDCCNSLRTATGLGQKVLSNYMICYNSVLAKLYYYRYAYNTNSSNSYNSGSNYLSAGQLLIEYFVPST